jgi:hypothetical protein
VAFLAEVRCIALSRIGVPVAPLPRALLRKASAGVALLRGDLATDAPRASTGETCSMRIELEAGSGRMVGAGCHGHS